MARKSERPPLALTAEQRAKLQELSASRVAPAREVDRAKVMLGYADGASVNELQRRLGFSRPMMSGAWIRRLPQASRWGSKTSTTGHTKPRSATKARRRWSASHAPSPRTMGWQPSCGRSRRWRALLVSAPRLQAFPAWPIRARAPSGAS
jgi:hypothetical protein